MGHAWYMDVPHTELRYDQMAWHIKCTTNFDRDMVKSHDTWNKYRYMMEWHDQYWCAFLSETSRYEYVCSLEFRVQVCREKALNQPAKLMPNSAYGNSVGLFHESNISINNTP